MGDTMTCIQRDTRGNRVSVEPDGNIYHEKQSKELCALHALNNLFQDENAFTKSELDNICYKMSPNSFVNPHKSMFGLGNYDVNVIMAALQTKNCDTIWFDKRKDISSLMVTQIQGFILNIPTDYKWGIFHLPMQRKHWVSLRKIKDNYYNLDSKLDAPELVGPEKELILYLKEQIECKEKELLLVVSQEVASDGTWIKTNDKVEEDPKTDITDVSDKQMIKLEEKRDLLNSKGKEVKEEEDTCLANGSVSGGLITKPADGIEQEKGNCNSPEDKTV